MNDFDARWQRLTDAARRAAPSAASMPPDPRQFARIVQIALRESERQRETARQGHGLLLAAGLFLTALTGLGLAAQALGVAPDLQQTARELARAPQRLPSTAFVPAPPNAQDFGLPSLTGASPAQLFSALDRMLSPLIPTELFP